MLDSQTTKPKIQTTNHLKTSRIGYIRILILTLAASFSSIISEAQTSNPVFNWKAKEISPGNNLQAMCVHNENTAVIAGFGSTLKMTTDKGLTWNDVGVLVPKYNFIDISIKNQVGYLIARKTQLVNFPAGGENNVYASGVVLKSTDGGNNWLQLDLSKIGTGTDPSFNPSLPGCFALNPYSVLCVNDTTALVFLQWNDINIGTEKTHSVVFKTVNGGKSWTAFTPDFGAAYITSMKMIGNDIYIGGKKILLKASATDDTLTDLFPAFSAVAGSTAFVNEIRPFQIDDVYIVTTTGVYNSTNSGQTFTKINGLTGGFDFFKLDNNVAIVLGTSSASRATSNGGSTWSNCYPGKTCFEISGVFNDSLYALSSLVVFKIAVSDLKSGKYKWVSQTLVPGNSNLQKMYIFDASTALIIGDDQTAKITTDKGITWSDAALPKLKLYGTSYDFRSVSATNDAGYASTRRMIMAKYASGENYYLNGLIYKTDDAWKTWTVLNNKNIGKDTPDDASKYPLMTGCYGADDYTIECVDANTAYVYVGWSDTVSVPKTETKHSRVFKTTDGGSLWTAVTRDFGSSVVMSIKFSGDTGYVAGNKILLKTVDGGKTFTDLYPTLAAGTDSNLVISAVTMYSPEKIYLPTSNSKGIYYSNNGGSSFSKLNGVTSGLGLVALDKNSLLAVGSSLSNKFTNDGGATWTDAKLGIAIYAAGEVLNDSLYVLAKSNAYKIAVADLDINTFVAETKTINPLQALYGSSALKLVSSAGNMDRCMVYNISGQLVTITEPRATTCTFQYNSFTPGVYLIAVLIDGKKYVQKVMFK